LHVGGREKNKNNFSPEPSVRNKENIKREGALHRPNVDGIQICKCADGLTDMQIFK